MSDKPEQPQVSRDPLCPDCQKPFNPVKDFKGRLAIYAFGGGMTNIYKCPHCGHLIYRMSATPADTNDRQG